MNDWRTRAQESGHFREYNRAYRKANPEQVLLNAARRRARVKGVPCTITLKDIRIPDFCPVLGIELVQASGVFTDQSPTLDRRVPEDGYVPGNVCVVSYRANRIKNDASIDELKAVLAYMEL